MGKGRKPCCDKAGVKKGPWSQAEDLKLMSFIQKHGHSNWRALPRLAGLARCGKSCRLRWVNYLRPDLKRGHFAPQEEEAIIKLHEELGNKWSKIASYFPGRTDNEIKNVWNTHLKKRLKDKQSSESASESCNNNLPTSASTCEVLDKISNNDCPKKVLMHQTSTLDEPPSSSCTSNVSQASQCDHQLEEINPIVDELQVPSSNVIDQDCDTNAENSLIEELIEIPFEPNLDFWDLLDGDQSNSAHNSDQIQHNQGHSTDTSLNQIVENDTTNNGTSMEEDGGRWWWLVYLENELGLAHNEAISPQSTIGCNDHELLFKGEETYFHT